ncbi:hypothetical protein RB597_010162 [Gaeumannomyces tritici]
MPKRYLDVSNTMPLDRIQRKTERSHEENQERAYIAASRRADRSIEARVQSARMASDIHRRRTGKGFKISEEIVMKEEMYEEEEDDLPRYRALAALGHRPPSGAETTDRFGQYGVGDLGLGGKLEHMREIERQFEESFPNAAHMSQGTFLGHIGARQSFQHFQQQPQQNPQQQQQQHQPQRKRHQQHEPPNRGFSHSPMLDYASRYARERSQSISQASAAFDMATRRHTIAVGMPSHHSFQPQLQASGLGDDAGSSSLSPPALTPGAVGSSGSSSSGGNAIETPTMQYQPSFAPTNSFTNLPATTSMDAFGSAAITSGPDGVPFLFSPHSTTNFHSQGSEHDIAEGALGSDWGAERVFYQEPSMYPRDMDLETRDACGGCFDQRPPSAASSGGMSQSRKAPQHHQQPPVATTSAPDDYFGHIPTITAGPPLTRFENLIDPRSGSRSAAVTPGTDGFDTFFDMDNYARAVAAASTAAPPWNNQTQN